MSEELFSILQEAEKFRPPEVPPAAKAALRQMLPIGLKESISKGKSRYLHLHQAASYR
jgi:hypothetical protein